MVDGAVGTLHRQTLVREYFRDEYLPSIVDNTVRRPLPVDDFDFEFDGAYSIYNWELFFHAPFMIAKRLERESPLRRGASLVPLHLRADQPPARSEAPWPECVWNIKPFVEHGTGRTIEQMMLLLHTSGLTDEEQKQRDTLNKQVEAWRKNPFNPHLIARMRVQPYMMAVVMAYLDNLIAWADDLFRRDTMESVNEASQLYLLAAELLGDRPREIAAHEGTFRTIDGEPVRNFNDLRPHLDTFSNALVDMETILHPGQADQGAGDGGGLLDGLDYTGDDGPGLRRHARRWRHRGGSDSGLGRPHLVLLHPAQRQARRLLGHRGGSPLQDPPLHEHRRRGPTACAVRAADRPGAARAGDCQRCRASETPWRA